MKVDGIEVPEIRQRDFMELLKEGENLLVYGNKGVGKSSIVKEYAEANKKQVLIFSLATMLPEYIGGIPYAKVSDTEKTNYFTLLLNEALTPILEAEGKDYILFFDEINQAPTEVMNCLYSICHIDPDQRTWCGHSLKYAQIVGAGNLSDGTDGTVYLNELPGPLLDRFFVYQLVSSKQDVANYLKKKYKNIPQIAKYIKIMQEANINPRNMDKCLDLLQCKKNPLLLRTKLGTAVTQQILDLQKGIEGIDPTELLKGIKLAYERFKEDGIVAWGSETITTEEQLIEKFKELVSEEELASVISMKGSDK